MMGLDQDPPHKTWFFKEANINETAVDRPHKTPEFANWLKKSSQHPSLIPIEFHFGFKSRGENPWKTSPLNPWDFSWFFHPKIGSKSQFQDKESDSEDEEDDTAREQQMQRSGKWYESWRTNQKWMNHCFWILRFHSIFSGCEPNILNEKNVVHIWIQPQAWCNKLDSLPTLNWASSLQRTRFVFHAAILCQDNRNWLSILEETNPSQWMKFWSNSGTLQGTLGNSQIFNKTRYGLGWIWWTYFEIQHLRGVFGEIHFVLLKIH